MWSFAHHHRRYRSSFFVFDFSHSILSQIEPDSPITIRFYYNRGRLVKEQVVIAHLSVHYPYSFDVCTASPAFYVSVVSFAPQ